MGQMQTQVSEQIDEGSKHEGISCDKADGIPGTESPESGDPETTSISHILPTTAIAKSENPDEIPRTDQEKVDAELLRDFRSASKDTIPLEEHESLVVIKRPSRPIARGNVRIDDPKEHWYRYYDTDEWLPAIPHDAIRKELIKEASAKGQYAHQPAKGTDPCDITSFLEDHKGWGPLREDRPSILFQFEPPKPRDDPAYTFVDMVFEGRIVLDWARQPVKGFYELPATISSKIEGWRMEAILRIISKIKSEDLLARMICDPEHRNAEGDWIGKGRDRLVSNNCLAIRMDRWRKVGRCVSWKQRLGSISLKNYIFGIMTPEMRHTNSTRGLTDIVLGSGELEHMNLINCGSKPTCVKRQQVSDDKIKERKIKTQKKADRWNESQGAKSAGPKSVNTAQQQLSLNQRNDGTNSTASQEGSSADYAIWINDTAELGKSTKSATGGNAHATSYRAFIRSQSAPI